MNARALNSCVKGEESCDTLRFSSDGFTDGIMSLLRNSPAPLCLLDQRPGIAVLAGCDVAEVFVQQLGAN